jgi:hypothetical protein
MVSWGESVGVLLQLWDSPNVLLVDCSRNLDLWWPLHAPDGEDPKALCTHDSE